MKRIGIVVFVISLFVCAVSFALSLINKSLAAKEEQGAQIDLQQGRIVLGQIRKLQKASPEQDFAKAWAKEDYRFMGDYGQLYFIPGVTKDQANAILRQKNVNFIQGTGNGVDTADEEKLHHLAVNYATRYNELLLKSLKSKQK